MSARALGAALLALGLAAGAAEAAPRRVVSMNLCTDQLALLLAAPGQLVSVTWLAQDPDASAMAEAARAYPANHGLAEEIFLMAPDLVLAGRYGSAETVAILRRLGVEVLEVAPAESLEDVPARLAEIGRALGRERKATELSAAFRAGLAAAARTPGEARPVAALYYANSYTSGGGTLAGEIVEAAGFANLGAELGYEGMTRLPLELLALAEPDLVVEGQRYAAPALAQAGFDHPALAPVKARSGGAALSDRHWVCGAPAALEAVRRLAAVAARLERE